MKKIFLLIFLSAPVMANGPKYVGPRLSTVYRSSATMDKSLIYQEFVNAYHDIQYPIIAYAQISSETVTATQISTATLISSATISSATIGNLIASTATLTSVSVSTFTLVSSATITNATITNLTVSSISGVRLGKLLQRKACSATTSFTTTNTSFQTTNLSCTITPFVATSSITVFACSTLENSSGNNNSHLTIARGGTNQMGSDGEVIGGDNVASLFRMPACVIYHDFPNTTSATTYAVQLRVTAGTGTFGDGANNTQFMILDEVAQ